MVNKGFASDNNSGIHPNILKAIEQANVNHALSYGDDDYTKIAQKIFKKQFGKQAETFFVFTGTAANVLGLKASTEPYNSVICSELAHINVDECGAPEKFTGCKLCLCPTKNGKISIVDISKHINNIGFQHHVQPKVVSISQTTELGTVYTPAEIKEIAYFTHSNNMLLHVDGARLANAAAALKMPFEEFTTNCGVDFLSFGGTKNGMMCGEAIIFLNSKLAKNFMYTRKQGMQLASKMRFISAQFIEYLKNDLCIKTATHANNMAKLLAEKIRQIPQINITQKVEANTVFATIPKEIYETLKSEYFFYLWDEKKYEARWMCSFDTNENDVENFVNLIKKLVEKTK